MQIIHTEADGGKGGQPLRIINESLGLIQRGHQITILCPETAPLHALAREAGLTVVTMPLTRKNFHNLKRLRRWMNENRAAVDVINSHNSADTWLVALANLTLSNPIPLVRTRHASGLPRNNWTTRWLFRKACAHIVTTGEALRQQMVDIGIPMARSTSVPSGVDVQRFHPGDKQQARAYCGLSQDDFWLGMVSRVRPNKGHRVLLRALAKIENPRIRLAIVGEGPHKVALEEEIVTLGLQQRVVMVGHQSEPERWFQAFDIALSPSYDMEGLPQGVLQSLASRIATVATDAGGTVDAVIDGQTGICIPQLDETALYEAIIRLYNDEVLREKLARQGYEHFQASFTHNCMLEKMEKVFANVSQLSRSQSAFSSFAMRSSV